MIYKNKIFVMNKIALLIAFTFTFNYTLIAQTSYTWIGATSTAFSVPTNWSPVGVPLPTDNVTIVTGANNCVLTLNTTVTNLTITSGILNLNGFTLTSTGVVLCNGGSCTNGTFNASATSLTFAGTTFGANVTASVSDLYFNGSIFNGTVTATKTGAANNSCNGNNTFNGLTSLTNSGTGFLLLTNGGVGRVDVFNAPTTVNATNTGTLYLGYTRDMTINSSLTVNNTAGSPLIYLGNTGNVNLTTGATISCGTFAGATLYINRVVQTGTTAQVLTPGNAGIVNINNCNFTSALTVNAGRVIAQTSTFGNAVTYSIAGTIADYWSGGGNTYNGVLTVNNSSSGYVGFANGTTDIYNNDVYANNTSTTGGRIIFGNNCTSQFNGNIYVSQSGTTTASGIALGWGGTFPVVNLAAGKNVFVNGSFSSGYLQLLKMQTAATTAINLTTTGISNVQLNNSVFNGNVTITAPNIYAYGSTHNAPTSFIKTGGTDNHNGGYLNTFNATLNIQNQSTGYFMLGYQSADKFNDNVTVSSTGTGGIYFDWFGSTGTPTLAAGKTLSIGSGGYTAGALHFGGFTQLGTTTPINLTLTGTAYFETNTNSIPPTFNSTLTVTAPDITLRGGVFNSAVVFTKTGGTSNHNNGIQNIFNSSCTINQQSTTGYFMLGYNSNDLFNGDIVVTNTGTQDINLGWSSGTGTPTQAAGYSITVGAAGFSGGGLNFNTFTQLGTSPVNLIFTGATASLLFARNSVFNGNITSITPNVYFNGATFNGTVNSIKNGVSNNAGAGGNTFNSVSSFTNMGGGYLMFGNGSADVWNADATFTNSGTSQLYMAYNSVGTLFNGNVTLSSTGGSLGIQFCAAGGATATMAAGRTLSTGVFDKGYLILQRFTQLGTGAVNLTLTSTAGYLQYGPSSALGGNVVSTSPDLYLHGCVFNGTSDITKTGSAGNFSQGGNIFNGVCTITNAGSNYLLLGNTNPDIWNSDVTFTNTGSERLLPAWATVGNMFNGNIYVNTSGSAQGIQFCGGNSTATATLAAGKTIAAGGLGLNAGYLQLKQFTQLGNTPINLTMTATAGYLQYGPLSSLGGDVVSSSPRLFFNGCVFNGTVTATKYGAIDDAGTGGNVFNSATTINNSGSGILYLGNGTADAFNGVAIFNITGSNRIHIANNHAGQTSTFAQAVTLNANKTASGDAWSYLIADGTNTNVRFDASLAINIAGAVQSNFRILTGAGSTGIYNGDVTINLTNTNASTQVQMNNNGIATYNGNISVANTGAASGVFFNVGTSASSTLNNKTISLGAGGFTGGDLSLLRFTQLGAIPQALVQTTGTARLILGPTNIFNGDVNFNFPQVFLSGTTYNGTATIEKNGASDNYGNGGNVFNSTATITNSGSGYLLTGGTNSDIFNGITTFNNTGSYRIYFAHSHAGQTTTFAQATTLNANKTGGADAWSYLIADGTNTNVRFDASLAINIAGAVQSNFRILTGAGSTAIYNGDVTINLTNTNANTQVQMNNNGIATYNGNISVASTGGANGIYFNTNTTATSTLNNKTISLGAGGFTAGTLSLVRFTQLGAVPQTLLQPTGTALLIMNANCRFDGDVNFNFPQFTTTTTTFNGITTLQKNGASDNYSSGGNVFNASATINNSSSSSIYFGNGAADAFNGVTTFNNTGSYRTYIANNHAGQTTTFAQAVTLNANKTGGADAWSYLIAEGTSTNVRFDGALTLNIAGALQSNLRILDGNTTTAIYNGDVIVNLSNTNANTQVYMGSQGTSTYNGNISVLSTGGANGIYFNNNSAATSTLNNKAISLGVGGFTAGRLSLVRFTQLGAVPQTLLQPIGTALLTMATNCRFDGDVNFNFPQFTTTTTTFNGITTLQKNGASDNYSSGGNVFNTTTTINNSSSGGIYFGNGAADAFNGVTTFNNTGSYRTYIANNHAGQTTTFAQAVTLNANKTGGADTWSYFIAEGNNTNVRFDGLLTLNINGALQSNMRILQGTASTAIYNGDVIVNLTNTNSNTFIQMGTAGTSTYNGNISVINIGGANGIYFNATPTASSTLNNKAISLGAVGFTAGALSLARFTQLGAVPQTLVQTTGTALLTMSTTCRFDGDVNFNFPQFTTTTTTFNGITTLQKNGASDNYSSGGNIFNTTTTINNSSSASIYFGNGAADAFNGLTTFNNTGSYRTYIANNHAGQTTTFAQAVTLNANKTGGADAWSYLIADGPNTNVRFDAPLTINIAGAVQSNFRILAGTGSTGIYNGDVAINLTNTNVNTNVTMGIAGTSTYNGNISVANTGGANSVYFNTNLTATSTQATTKSITTGVAGFTSGFISMPRFTQLGTATNSLLATGATQIDFGPASVLGATTTTSGRLFFNSSIFNGAVNSTKNGVGNDASAGGNTFNNTFTLTNNAGVGGNLQLGGSTAGDTYKGDVIFVQNNVGILYPNHNFNSTYEGNISVGSSGAYTIGFGQAGGTATLTGTNSQTVNKIGTTVGNPTFTRLVVNKASNSVTLNTRVNISATLTLTQGLINTTATNVLNMNNLAIASPVRGSATSYVNGPMNTDMALNGTRTLNMPIGKATNWRPVTLIVAHNAATSYTYNSEAFNANAWELFYTLPVNVTHVSSRRYWDINRSVTSTGVNSPSTNLSGNATVTLYYGVSDSVTDPANVTICKNTNGAPTTWINIGGTGASVGAGSVTSTSTPTAFNSFSRFTLGNRLGGTNPLPVALLYFTAKAENNTTKLSWATASETNNNGFEVERSIDGINFEYVTTINAYGSGNSTNKQTYTTNDENPYKGVSYYRLKQVDNDGAYEYSNIESVEFKTAKGFINFYPNPATNVLQFSASTDYSNATIKLINALGEIVVTQSTTSTTTGSINISNLASGMYHIVVENKNQIENYKIVIQE